MQLVAYGAQDTYLSGSPQVTFFKIVYRRHTNFAVEPIQQTWNGSPDFARTVTCNINRNGDLITNMYVAVTLKEKVVASNGVAWGYVNRLGHAMIDNVKVEIGGSKIDEQYGDWLNIWYELTHKAGQVRGYDKMIGNIDSLTEISTNPKKSYQLYIPLQFWFNRNNGLALPLISLQYHDVRITLNFKKAIDCINWKGSAVNAPSSDALPEISDSYLLIDYIYLDSEERKRFAQAAHEYLIEQLQFTGSESLSDRNKYRLNFNHPSKYLIWAPHLSRYYKRNEWIAYAVNNDWDAAKERFAKILYLATRNGLASSVTGSALTTSSTEVWVNPGTLVSGSPATTTGAAGDLFEPNSMAGLPSEIIDMLSKIEVKLVCQQDTATTDAYAKIANASTSLLSELLSNSIVIRNELTFEDISKTVADLSSYGILNSPIISLSTVSVVDYFNYGNFVNRTDNPVYNAKIQLNGHDRFQDRDGNYFNYVQPYQHFSNTPSDGINVYSFALKAEDHQPTGTCNFSRIDNATLIVNVGLYNSETKDTTYTTKFIGSTSGSLMNIYTTNYNILRIMSGMGGLAYSN